MIQIDGVVEIPQCGLYVKSPEALEELFAKLKEMGYEIEDCSQGKINPRPPKEVQEKEGWYLWHARLRDNVCEQKGKCNSCGSYIDVRGIKTHKHRCEVCGAYTYHDFVKGSSIRFFFAEDARGQRRFEPDIKMKIYGYDEELGCLLLYPKPLEGNNFNDLSSKNALKVLNANRKQFRRIPGKLSKGARKHIRRLKAMGKKREARTITSDLANRRFGLPLIAIPYDPRSHYVGVINTVEIWGRKFNHKIVRLYGGKEYGEWDTLPEAESFEIYEAWHWMPLRPSPALHEKIIHAASMVTDCGYYHQDGRDAFYDIHLERMHLYVEHFTTIPIDQWDALIARTPKSGPGMIKALAAFCQGVNVEKAAFEDKPNVGNMVHGFYKAIHGWSLTPGEKVAVRKATADPETCSTFLDIFRRTLP